MRDLTGRVEEVHNGLDQLRQRVEQINSDIDVRLGGQRCGRRRGPRRAGAGQPLAAADAGDPGRVAGCRFAAAGRSWRADAAGHRGPAAGPATPNSGGLDAIFGTLTPPGERGPPRRRRGSAVGCRRRPRASRPPARRRTSTTTPSAC